MIIDAKDQKKSLSHYLIKAETIKRASDIFAKILGLANSYFIISSLSVFSFGFYQLILSFISILRSLGIRFFDGLVAIDMRRYFNTQKTDYAKRLFLENAVFKCGVAIVMANAVFFGADLIAGWYGKDISILIKWASALLITNAFQSLTAVFLDSVVSFNQNFLALLREFLKLILILYFVFFAQFGILQVIIAHVVSEIIAVTVFSTFVFIKNYRKAFVAIRAKAEHLLIPLIKNYGSRVFAVFTLKEVLQDSVPWLIKFFVNTEGVALYSLSVNLISLMQDLIPMSGMKPLLVLKADDPGQFRFLFSRSIKYVFWFGTLLLIASFIIVPPFVKLLFPDYAPAIPIFWAMALALPIYGVVKVIAIALATLREYTILTMRLVNEILILFIGSAILLPSIGMIGIGLIYFVRHLERLIFLYTRLVKKHAGFKIKFINLFKFDDIDRQFIRKIFHNLFLVYWKRV